MLELHSTKYNLSAPGSRHWFHVSYPGKTVTKGIREGGGRGGGSTKGGGRGIADRGREE